MGLVLIFILVMCLIVSGLRAARRKRIEAAYRFDRPNIHGTRKFATREQLKKAGLI